MVSPNVLEGRGHIQESSVTRIRGGLQTPDVVALVAFVAHNELAGAIPAAAHSAMKIGAPVEAIWV